MSNKRAIILAGGRGTRLKPYTTVLPKPLMPIGDYPILEVIVRQLTQSGFKRITMAVNHQAELIKAYFGNGTKWDIDIDYSIEDIPMGTMGPLKLIRDLPDNFLVMNGDILTDLDFNKFYEEHILDNSLFSISANLREERVDYGVLEIGDLDTLIRIQEKPINKYLVSMGIYMVNHKILPYITDGVSFGFDNLMHELLRAKQQVNVKKYHGYWLDIGRPDDYMQAIEQFDNMKNIFIHE